MYIKEKGCVSCDEIIQPTSRNQKYCLKEKCQKIKNDSYLERKRRYSKIYEKKNRKRISERVKLYNRIHKPKKRLKANTPKVRYKTYQLNSRKREMKFDITFEQFMTFWNNECSYCGDKINGIGLDRADNNIGYVIDNIASCCYYCNRMKWTMPKNDFINHCKKIANLNK